MLGGKWKFRWKSLWISTFLNTTMKIKEMRSKTPNVQKPSTINGLMIILINKIVRVLMNTTINHKMLHNPGYKNHQ